MEKLNGLGNNRKFLDLVDLYKEAITILEKQKRTKQGNIDSLSTEEQSRLKEILSRVGIAGNKTTENPEEISRYGDSFSPEEHRKLQGFDAKLRTLMQ